MLADPEFENSRCPRLRRAAWNGTIVAVASPHTTTSSARQVLEQPLDEVVRVDRRQRSCAAHRRRPGTAPRAVDTTRAIPRAARAGSRPRPAPASAASRNRPASAWIGMSTLTNGRRNSASSMSTTHLERAGCERLPVVADLTDGQSRTDDQQQVGVLDGEVAGARADRSLSAAEVRIVAGDEVVRPGRRHRDAQSLERPPRTCPGHRTSRTPLPASSTGRRAAESRSTQLARRAADELRPRLPRGPVGGLEAAKRLGIDRRRLDIDGHVQPDGPGTAGPSLRATRARGNTGCSRAHR